MLNRQSLREGMQVFDAAGQHIGTVERLEGEGAVVNGRVIPLNSLARVEGDRLFLQGTPGQGMTGARGQETVHPEGGEIRVPTTEERLEVEKRPVDLGEVQVRKTVHEEQQTVPTELRREQVQVERRDVAERPAGQGERPFEETTIRVPVRGEEAVARKEAVVTGEVVVDKTESTERQDVSETVRREQVHVDGDRETIDRGRPQVGAQATQTGSPAPQAGAQGAGMRGAAQAATGAAQPRGLDEQLGAGGRTRVSEGAAVLSSDGEQLGQIKEVRDGDFLLDRRGQRDIYVPFDAVQRATAEQVELNVAADDVDNMGWQKPPLL